MTMPGFPNISLNPTKVPLYTLMSVFPTFFWFCKLFERGKIFSFSYKLLNKTKFEKNLSVERKF